MINLPLKFNPPTYRAARQGNPGLAGLRFAVFLAFALTLSLPALAQQASPDHETVGVPWSGEKGSRETMAEITARQQREDQLSKGKPKKFRLKTEKELPDLDLLPQNPDSPSVARWVPSRNIADNVSTLIAPA